MQASLSSQPSDFNMYLTSSNSHFALVDEGQTITVPHRIDSSNLDPIKDDKLARIGVHQIDATTKEIRPKAIYGINYRDTI